MCVCVSLLKKERDQSHKEHDINEKGTEFDIRVISEKKVIDQWNSL